MRRTAHLIAALAALMLAAGPAAAAATVYYDAVPDPLPSNVASLGNEAYSTYELGQLVEPASTGDLNTATVTMSSWACETGQWQDGDCDTTPGATFDHDITVNLYDVDDSGTDPAVGPLLGSVTQTIAVPYRPSVDSTCNDYGDFGYPTGYKTDDLNQDEDGCTNGYAFNATFDLSSLGLTLDSPVIATVTYNTEHYGPSPLGVDGPYDALNIGIDLSGTQPTVGTAGDIFWDTSFPGYVTDGLSSFSDFGWTIMVSLGYEQTSPVTADDCKDGGYEDFGFRNQGQCVASGKASEQANK